MRAFLAVLCAWVLAEGAGLAQLPGDTNEGSVLVRNPLTGGYSFKWWGRAGKSYFILQTDNLLNGWTYLPEIVTGADAPISWGFTSSGAQFFLKLELVDDPYGMDRDGDGLSDGLEVINGMSPVNSADALEDKDGDGIPNAYEAVNGSDPNSSGSLPTPHYVVGAAGAFITIQDAVDAAYNSDLPWRIIEVKRGRYVETVNISSTILLRAETSEQDVIISGPNNDRVIGMFAGNTVLSGFVITRNEPPFDTPGLLVDLLSEPKRVQVTNCIFRDLLADRGAAFQVFQGAVTFTHCTFMDNEAPIGGRAGWVKNQARVALRNCVVWNPRGFAPEQILVSPGAQVSAMSSIILGGEFGASAADPLLDRYGGPYLGSPALNTGTVLPIAKADRHGALRAAPPTMGAMELNDSDSDLLPDWWELRFFGDLMHTAAGDDDLPTGDNLENRLEYIFGTNPTQRDSDGDGLEDLPASIWNRADRWYPANLLLDGDNDGLTNGNELLHGSDAADADTNDDGLLDLASVQAGIPPGVIDWDADGLDALQELALGTSPFLADTDHDSVPDGVDAFPLDPSRAEAPAGIPGDTAAPQITLDAPIGAVPL